MTKKKTRKYEHEEPVSLAPLDFREALAALVRVKPEDIKEDGSREERDSGEGQGAEDAERGK